MNRAALTRLEEALLAAAAAVHDLADDGATTPRPSLAKPKKRRARSVAATAPANVSDLDIARARSAAKRAGILVR